MHHFTLTTIASLGFATAVLAQSTTCGAKGYDKSSPVAFFVDKTATTGPTCQALCVTKSAVAFGVSTSTCYCYSAPVANNLTPNATSENTFYDIGCNLAASTSAASTASAAPALSSASSALTSTVTKRITSTEVSTALISITSVSVATAPTSAPSADCTDEITLTVTAGASTLTTRTSLSTAPAVVRASTSTTALATPTIAASNSTSPTTSSPSTDDSSDDSGDDPEEDDGADDTISKPDPLCVDPTITVTAAASTMMTTPAPSVQSLPPAYVTEYATAYTTVVVQGRRRRGVRRS